MSADAPQAWTLSSVLFSARFRFLRSLLAATLHETAVDLYRRSDDSVSQVAGDLVNGRVVNLKRTLQLGGMPGPAFEAKLDTERGAGTGAIPPDTSGSRPARHHARAASRRLPELARLAGLRANGRDSVRWGRPHLRSDVVPQS